MITLFRNFAKSKWATGLLVLVALALLFTGGQQLDVVGALTPHHVVDAGARSIDAARFRSDFDRVRENLQQQAQRSLTIEDLVKENILVRYLDSQKSELGFLDWAWKAGIRPGKELVIKEIRKLPIFLDPITGQFSEDTYRSQLAERNLTPAIAEQGFRDQYIVKHYSLAIAAGARLPRIYGALAANQALESRDARWFNVTRAMAGTTPPPTDAQLTAFMQQNAAEIRSKPMRVGSLVLFNSAPGAAAAVSDADIQKRFDFRKDALSQPEKRTFVTLTAPTRATADKIAAALRSGQSPGEVAGANNLQPTEFNDTPRAGVTDPAVADAVFGLAPGQVSDPVQGRVGFTVVRVASISPARPVTLPEVRAQIIEELKGEAERTLIFQRVTRYDEARKTGKTLEEAAALAGARVVPLPPLTEDGKRPDGQQVNLPPQILENLWKLQKGADTDAVDLGHGEYFVLRVDQILPAVLPPLDRVRPMLAAEWTRRENARLLVNRANALEARIRAGEDIVAVARSVGAEVVTRAAIQAQPTPADISQGLLQAIFGTDRGQVFGGQVSADVYVVGRVDAVTPAVAVLAAPMAEDFRNRMTQQALQPLVGNAIEAAAARTKARYDMALARQALNLPAEAPGAPAPASPAQ